MSALAPLNIGKVDFQLNLKNNSQTGGLGFVLCLYSQSGSTGSLHVRLGVFQGEPILDAEG